MTRGGARVAQTPAGLGGEPLGEEEGSWALRGSDWGEWELWETWGCRVAGWGAACCLQPGKEHFWEKRRAPGAGQGP